VAEDIRICGSVFSSFHDLSGGQADENHEIRWPMESPLPTTLVKDADATSVQVSPVRRASRDSQGRWQLAPSCCPVSVSFVV
jgi:hypothetical protein